MIIFGEQSESVHVTVLQSVPWCFMVGLFEELGATEKENLLFVSAYY